ncbi:Rho-type gtpase-activating protein [Lithohypha guttulata]|uniref:Rho-type gtpase-activating protein n=1 Tax=Lithohypha guttulata TaxID=1690604 RepID=A0AAN7YHE6_9EURO|nr:Rho-type gtpase-activating protein [Lithohypha guttulata]
MAAATMLDQMHYTDSATDPDEQAYPCKGCGEILEEGKAFELAGNRWHIDCFRCNTCNSLLDSDANLLLLGDGSLICNNCTYSCSSCGDKIEDLAILTGDQAFCANCFKCRNCKRKIENLRYARTTQGIFCMDCHEALMARRRKKTAKGSSSKKSANIDKSLPAIPPPEARHTAYVPNFAELESPPVPSVEVPSVSRTMSELRHDTDSDNSRPPTSSQQPVSRGLTLPSTTYKANRNSFIAQRSDAPSTGEEFLIPLAFDPNPPKQPPATSSQQTTPQIRPETERSHDYFATNKPRSQNGSVSQSASPHVSDNRPIDHARKQPDIVPSRQSSNSASTHLLAEQHQSPHISQLARNDSSKSENFHLQEAPRSRKMASNTSTPRQDVTPALIQQRSPETRDQEFKSDGGRATPHQSYEMSPQFSDGFGSPQPLQSVARDIPKRGDSLATSQNSIPRKAIDPGKPLNDVSNASPAPRQAPAQVDMAKANGGKVISAPISSPDSQSIYDTPNIPQFDTPLVGDKFVQPRVPPLPPFSHTRYESISTLQSDAQKSPKLPRFSSGEGFTLEEDISRILGVGFEEPTANESFLRRVSNSVRHGRSYSDKSGRFSRDRWPKSPTVTGLAGQEISSPSTSSPEHREELAWFKNELRRERQKNVEREKKITELEAQINAAADITQVDVELKEKRSTMVVLDTQKEIVVRELEVLTEHIANTKRSGEPLDMNKMNSAVLRDLAEALSKLKQSYTPQIEQLVHKKNELTEEISNLNQQKDKSFHEFEQLSIKNAQLAEFNNQLVDQIQNIYKSNRGPGLEAVKQPSGLGIYSHHKEPSKVSIEGRDTKSVEAVPTFIDPGQTYEAGEAGAIQTIGGAQVVEMKKGAVAKRFDWRKGQKMAKGLTKGVKGAFTSAQQNYGRDMQFAETGAYNQGLQSGQEYSQIPRNVSESHKQAGWFVNQKPPNKNGLYASSNNASTPSLLADGLSTLPLFGTELEVRADYEKGSIPGIVKRCIAEVEARGLDVEGIYRKSGGNSQVQQVKEGFEKQPYDYDISDPDLDIHAVTSGLKQYFRKLPTPLITYEVYDTLIEVTKIPEGPNQKEERIEGLRNALAELPQVHHEILDYLMQHLAKVVVLEKENLMTPMNIAVVFAPTIMRPESVARELNDTKAKNEVVMWMVQDVEAIFGK